MKEKLQDAIRRRTLLGDGAMGTQLMLAGLEQGGCGEAWNLTHPERVLAIQRRYAEAGSDCILTNTFGGSRIMLNRHGHPDKVVEINRAAVAIARQAFGEREGYVIGDVGPFGGLLEPYGDFTEAQVRAAFEEQAGALVDAGADAILIETQTSLEELTLGIQAAKHAGATCIIGSMAYDVTLDGSTFRTMMGIDPERAANCMQEEGADIVALNCGTGMDMERARQALVRYKRVTDLPVMVQPNAGQPKLVAMKVVYDETPEQMVKGVAPMLEAGVNILGACCGSSPDHIRAFRLAMDEFLMEAESDMKTKLCDVNAAALEKLPQHTGDKSGVGVHYVDAYIKPMNLKLPDGTPVKCKRRGLKIVFSAGGKKGEGLLRRLAMGPDPVVMLDAALQEAARASGVEITVEEGAIWIGM